METFEPKFFAMEAKIAALEAELRRAKSFADPELFDKLQVSIKQREVLQEEKQELQESLAELEAKLADSNEAAQSQIALLQRQIANAEAVGKASADEALAFKVQRLGVSRNQRTAQLEVMRLQRELSTLRAERLADKARSEQLHALLADVFQPTNSLLKAFAAVQRQGKDLRRRVEEVGDLADATEKEKAQIERDFEAQRMAHNKEVELLKDSYEVSAEAKVQSWKQLL